MAGTYVYDQDFREERDRLAGMAALWDAGTARVLEEIGVSAGWRCLEIGAGGGSVTQMLSERVGPDGSVVSADVYTKFLEALELPNVEVRQLDVLTDELPADEFDLVYARLVVEHLGPPALRRMVPALKPGGILLLEDYDWAASGIHPPDDRFDLVSEAILGFMSDAGFDPYFGRRLPAELRAAGLADVRTDGRVRVFAGGTPESIFYRLSLASLGPAVVEQGGLAQEDLDAAIAAVDDPANTYLSPTLVAGWGRQPDAAAP